MEFLGPILDLIKCFGGPTHRYLDNHLKLEKNVNELRSRLDDLNIRKQDLELRKEAEVHSRKVVKKEVEKWFEQVQKMNTEMQKIEERYRVVRYLSRARLGKRVCRKIEEVKAIHQQGSFPEGVAVDYRPAASGVTFPTTILEGEVNVKEQIWAYLVDSNYDVGMIGVCGMGGIGKTTIMKHINNQLLEKNMFEKVVWVTVSKELNVFKLQQDIADAMDGSSSLPENGPGSRAAELMKILERKRHVLILDDVWQRFSLLDVGIPRPTLLHSGSKLVLTSRSIEVCKSMGCNKVVKVQPLQEQESLNLFLNHVGHNVLENPTLEEIVKLVVHQCGGLPLAIVTIAACMKGVDDDICEWRNALNELRHRVKSVKGLETEIFECLMFSYDRLGDPKLQNCFLYCSLYPEDYEIERIELIEKWIDEGLLDEFGTRQAMHDRGNSILNKLENNCLLEGATTINNDLRRKVRMHDVLRDMALWIKRAGRKFMVKAGLQLKEVPSEHEWTSDLEKVSLMNNSLSEIPPHISPKCYNLTTLLLQKNNKLEKIAECFFQQMPKLKVLDLSYTRILELPNSVSNLNHLASLVLRNCDRLRYVCSLAKLKALRKLDLFNTAIKEIPHGIEMLTNLTYLNLYSKDLKELPVEILPMFSHLQHLAITLNIKGEEAAKLRKLEVFLGCFYEQEEFEEYAKSMLDHQGPKHYLVAVGSGKPDYFYFDDGASRLIQNPKLNKEVCFINCKMGSQDLVLLPHDVKYVSIEECHGLKSLSNICLLHEGNELKSCYIRNCEGVECLIDLSLSSCNSVLQNLEKLQLEDLRNLRELVREEAALASTFQNPMQPAMFSCLKSFYLRKCSSMKKLWSLEMLQGLQNLEEIDVSLCENMEKIIESKEEEEEGNDRTIILPKLRKLCLFKLPELRSICRFGVMIPTDCLQYLEVMECRKLKRIPLSLPLHENGRQESCRLEEIVLYPEEWWNSLEWDDPNVKDMLLPFHLAEQQLNSDCFHHHKGIALALLVMKIEERYRVVRYLSRARLGTRVCQKIEEVKAIQQQGSFPEGVAVDHRHAASGVTFPTAILILQGRRRFTRTQIGVRCPPENIPSCLLYHLVDTHLNT
ncbi:Disease resistance protein [Corchorus olitorius]|uniref:Disease resistance protein n=1 Tax=Corchorus olitorius TaxID=93759 RepID=A0A1R3JII4_9ROSI|nr:Disease resistance protein [Corchorus olitorius]